MTKEQQAIKIIRQLIDESLESGVIKNIEFSNLVYNSYQILNNCINNLPIKEDLQKEQNIDGTSDSNPGS